MTRNPWRTRDGRKVLKTACMAADVAASMQEEIGDGLAEKIVREWLLSRLGVHVCLRSEPAGTSWSATWRDGKTIENRFGFDRDYANALIAAGLETAHAK